MWLLYLASGKGDQKLGAGHLTRLDPREKDVCTQLVLEFECGTGKMKLEGIHAVQNLEVMGNTGGSDKTRPHH